MPGAVQMSGMAIILNMTTKILRIDGADQRRFLAVDLEVVADAARPRFSDIESDRYGPRRSTRRED